MLQRREKLPSLAQTELRQPVSRAWAPMPVFLSSGSSQTMKGELCFDIKKAGTLHGFTAWFSVRFQNLEEEEPQLVLSTGPFHP